MAGEALIRLVREAVDGPDPSNRMLFCRTAGEETLVTVENGPLALRRTAEMAAVFMIGDGLLGLLQPRRHVDLWRSDVAAVDLLVRPFAGRTRQRRAYGLLQLGAGVLLASRLRR